MFLDEFIVSRDAFPSYGGLDSDSEDEKQDWEDTEQEEPIKSFPEVEKAVLHGQTQQIFVVMAQLFHLWVVKRFPN